MNFDPQTALMGLVGGVLIGGASVLLLAANGRIAGISGILGGLLRPVGGDVAWRAAFMIGLLVAPVLFVALSGAAAPTVAAAPAVVIAGGLLVGFGTRLGSGCTSGHGVCGLGRLSARSLVAVLTFMATAGATVFLVRHVVGA